MEDDLVEHRTRETSFAAQCTNHSANSKCKNGRVVRASISGSVDSGLIPIRVKPMTLKLVFTASLLDVQNKRDSVENKPASLLVVSQGKALGSIPPTWRAIEVADSS